MDWWLFGKHLSGGLGFICLILILLFVVLRIGNSHIDECVSDKECITYSPECCGCTNHIGINKEYQGFLNIQTKARCLFFTDECPDIDCPPHPIEAYCDDGVCTVRNIVVPVLMNDSQANE